MSKPTTGSLAITAWRNDDYFEYPLRVVGLDLRGLVLKMEIRASGDTPGDPLVRLDGVAQDQDVAQGLRVAGVSVVDGVEVSDLRIRMDRGTLQELDYQGELGSPAVFEYALLIGGLTRLIGPFILPAHAFGSNAAPAARPASYAISQPAGAPNGGATLTISADGGATVLMDGADLVSASIIRAEDAAEQTAADRDTVEGIASTSYQAVPTYAAREAIPLNKRQSGMLVKVMEGTPRVFEWRTDLYMPGAWVGQYTPAEIKNLGIDFTGELPAANVEGLVDAQDAIDSIAAIDIAGFRATALSGDANPKVELAWEVKGTPTAQTISWGSSTIAIAAAARTFTPKDWAAVKPIFVVGNSLSTSTDTTNRWSQLLAADRKQPLYSVARYTSDWSQVYRSGAAPLYLTIAGGALPAGGTAAAVTLINGSAPTASPSANPASFLNTGDGGLTTGVSMAGTIVAGTTARHVTVSIPNAASTAYSIVQDTGAAALPLTGPVLFIPDIAKQIETSDLILWTGNNYYYSGVGNAYGDYTNPQMWVDMARIVAAAAGNRVLILPILPAADEPADGTPNPNVPGETYHLRSARAAANARTESLFPTAIARDATGRTLLKRLQDSGNGSANDNADIAAGLVPRSLRSDALHLSAAGDAVVFAFVKEALARQVLPSPVTQGTVFTLTATGTNPRTEAEVRDTAYAVVRGGELAALLDPLRSVVAGVESASEYRETLASAVADLKVGTFFVSRDRDGVSAYPGIKRQYQRIADAPGWADRGPFADASDVGLGQVDNTADADKPTSGAQQRSIDQSVGGLAAYTDAGLAKRVRIDQPQALSDAEMGTARSNVGAAARADILPSLSMFRQPLELDDHDAIIRLFDYCVVHQVEGRIDDASTSPVGYAAAGNLAIHCTGTISNRDGETASGALLRLTGNLQSELRWRGGRLDQRGGPRSCIEAVSWAKADVSPDFAGNIVATPASSNSTSALLFDTCDRVITAARELASMSKGSNTQGSVPRAITIQSAGTTPVRALISNTLARDGHGTIVVGNIANGKVDVVGLTAISMDDNGIYNVGDAAEINLYSCNLDGAEEPIVNHGPGVVSMYGGSSKNSTNAFGLQDCGGIRLIGVDVTVALGRGLFRTRPGNTLSKLLELRDCTFRCRPAYPALDFSIGKVAEIIDVGNTWIIDFDSAVSLRDKLVAWADGDKLTSEKSAWILRDATGDIPAGARYIELPPVLSKPSVWKSRLVNETSNGAAFLRITNARQQLVEFSGLRSIPQLSAEVEPNYGDLTASPPRETSGSSAPTLGYWPRGSTCWNTAPDPYAPIGWVCTASGSPGTWKAFGTVLEVLTGAKTQSFAAVAAGDVSAETDVTVSGASLADAVLTIAFTEALPAFCTLQARVKSAGMISVWLKNNGTSPTTATASGSLRVKVART